MAEIKLVPLKIKICNSPAKSAIFPDWSKIDPLLMHNMPAEEYFDRIGFGAQYNRSGEKTDLYMVFVEKPFAEEAVKLFPDLVWILSEAECEDYWDNKAHVKDIDYVDNEALESIRLKKELNQPTPEEADALNPLKPHRGIRKNWNKTWKDFKQKYKIKLDTI